MRKNADRFYFPPPATAHIRAAGESVERKGGTALSRALSNERPCGLVGRGALTTDHGSSAAALIFFLRRLP